MYIIEKGTCVLENFVRKGDKIDQCEYKLTKGQYFGEVSLLYNTARTCTVTTLDYASFGKIHEANLKGLYESFPFMENLMILKASQYNDPYKQFLQSTLKKIQYFKTFFDEEIDHRIIAKIIYSMKMANYEAEG